MSVKKTVIKIDDQYGDKCFHDSMGMTSDNDSRKPEGFVEIFDVVDDGTKQLIGRSNLVLYQGREWIAERLFATNNASVTSTHDQFISWFGLGEGGTPIADPLNPTAPTSTDTTLDTEIPIHATDTNCADFRVGNYYKHPFDDVVFEQDASNSDKWLISKITISISTEDGNGHNLNEAGLFISNSVSGGHTGPFDLFARVTFPSIVKDTTRSLVFVWYIYV